MPRGLKLALAALAGALTVFGYAPFAWSGLPVLTLAGLFGLWHRAGTVREAAGIGFAFGAGLFGAGVSWVFVALETFGGMPAPVALIATAGFVAFLSIYPALAGAVCAWAAPPGTLARLGCAAAAFVLAEWLRGYLFTGFPWLAVGYSQLGQGPPGEAHIASSPLAGFAPVGGVWLVSLAVTTVAALLTALVDALEAGMRRRVVACLAVGLALFASGALLRAFEWTRPAAAPLPVSLVQGNIAQELKFDPHFLVRTYEHYLRLAAETRGRLVVLPESAFPVMVDELPDALLQRLAALARSRGGDLLYGAFVIEGPLPGTREPRVYNSVLSVGSSNPQLYRKHHLVPFGETIPLKPITGWVMRNLLSIPIGDQSRGPAGPPPLEVAGTRVAINICYEDAFGDELRAGARDAGFLVNVTNDAWYGRSIAARQHNQIAAMRALELGRPVLRATNTGITSAIDHRGQVQAELRWFATGILEVAVVPREGATPYLRLGDALALGIAAAIIAAAALAGRFARVGAQSDRPHRRGS